MIQNSRVAIIGAGITGVHLARRLAHHADVQIFEKSRGIGGRMSTRRAGEYQFDHGAQYFTAHSDAFMHALAPFLDSGVVRAWTPRLAALGAKKTPPQWTSPRYVAAPGMNALCKAMADGLTVHVQTRVAHIEKTAANTWRLTEEAGTDLGEFDWVVSTAPAEQSVKLMPHDFSEHSALRAAKMLGCYSLMIGGLDLTDLHWDAAISEDSPIAWIACNHSKPGRTVASSLMCQSDNAWAEARLEADGETVQQILMEAVVTLTGLSLQGADYVSLHKWRFAKVNTPSGLPFLLDTDRRLAAAGDWCGAGRVEAGFESADKLATALCFEDA